MKDKIMNNKELIVAIAIVLIFLATCSYAWLKLQVTGNKTNVLRAGTLKLTLDDTTSNGISLENAVPMSDDKGKTTTEYTFTLQNAGTAVGYTIYLDDIALSDGETQLEDSKVKYQLIKNGEETVALLSSLDNKIIDSGTIDKNKTNTYSLRVWIDSDAENEVMGKILSKELRVEAAQTKQTTPTTTAMCKRVTTLHKEVCTNSDSIKYCQADGYALNSEIEYGSLGTKGTLASGDGFDCDVNGDGEYDPATERFYYVSDATNGITTDSNTAVLIYYSNVSGGVPSNSTTYAYYSAANENWHGPVTAIQQLPTTTQWKTTLTNTKRQITTETRTTSTSGGTLPEFSYEGYAARLLTAQEVNAGCGFTIGSINTGELSKQCKYLMENTKYSNASNGSYGEWLESPSAAYSNNVWRVDGGSRSVSNNSAYISSNYGVRPAIEVAKSNISY